MGNSLHCRFVLTTFPVILLSSAIYNKMGRLHHFNPAYLSLNHFFQMNGKRTKHLCMSAERFINMYSTWPIPVQ
ncbi:unnamed protein product [Adineta ricciae]|uniref:Secreted protein n=1 Tax=Adineta ricciae TaxID=249248 RepID=A0A814LJU8_ADIRI|nr:unnamed protein product [Adineta ricciae]